MLIYQDEVPIALFNHNFATCQEVYMDIDKEVICIQYVLYYYKDILYGEYIIVENDQNNIIHRDMKYSRFIHWKLLTEYFAAELVYISGECIFFF